MFSSDIGFRKKSIEFYRKCLEVVDGKPENCLMVGDNYQEDVEMPKQLGMHAVWIKNPGVESPGTETEATLTLEEFDKLPEVVSEVFEFR